ncbi:hypothetical protein EXIGLDRAFT_319041 [Exidia glandulosa HHB12029]|uniref:Secreted protein n=1 Tax=Exidia glandulosa HHB12029 TaxID=1314781 RepID=A0A165Q3Y1_EXIGL|nr:hypothetical protein EXIGLDRAFT_319041 [Exidia glandulosa HHB12029]
MLALGSACQLASLLLSASYARLGPCRRSGLGLPSYASCTALVGLTTRPIIELDLFSLISVHVTVALQTPVQARPRVHLLHLCYACSEKAFYVPLGWCPYCARYGRFSCRLVFLHDLQPKSDCRTVPRYFTT